MAAGLGAGGLAALLVAFTAGEGRLWLLVASSLPLGVTALAMPAMTAVAIGSVVPDRVGLASGILNAARQTGGALGVAVLGALLSGGGAVPLRLPFVGVAGAYAAGVALAARGRRRPAGMLRLAAPARR
jgi:MFS transporter, DHA2 family, methylenomycin A resistance protein